MKRVFPFLLIFLLVYTNSISQMRGEKSIASNNIKSIYIKSKYISNIQVFNSVDESIKINYRSEGEYQNLFTIQTKLAESSLYIADKLQPFTNNPNDKLAAHKISVATIKLYIPKHISLFISTRQADVAINAKLPYLFTEVNSGMVTANYFEGDAAIYTITGSIKLTTKNANLITNSNTGTIYTEKMSGTHNIHLISLSGDISAYKIK
ncbi:hypothetical protein ACE939_13955 [Aquimarina sp. W85]|uniref:hypothetical protein n=1 Tax=Aquimarina rhodophyticola TaxID=3342246 RepID=UPI00366DEA1E